MSYSCMLFVVSIWGLKYTSSEVWCLLSELQWFQVSWPEPTGNVGDFFYQTLRSTAGWTKDPLNRKLFDENASIMLSNSFSNLSTSKAWFKAFLITIFCWLLETWWGEGTASLMRAAKLPRGRSMCVGAQPYPGRGDTQIYLSTLGRFMHTSRCTSLYWTIFCMLLFFTLHYIVNIHSFQK